MRKRINTRAIVSVDPSNPTDYYRVSKKAHKENLASSHNEFEASGLKTSFMMVTKPKSTVITEEYLRCNYRQVKFFGEWVDIRRFYGKLLMMYNDNFQFQ
jgi:hypothetical protein